MLSKIKPAWFVIITGGIMGAAFSLLVRCGNPTNMGICAICFLRDISGALGIHSIETLSYIRPEIIGFLLGACIVGLVAGEFKSKGGSSPILRFIIGLLVAIAALVFLGCPIRLLGRIAAGDWIALEGLIGLTAGIFVGVQFLKSGFSLGRMQSLPHAGGWVMPVIALGLLVLAMVKPEYIVTTRTGHAPLFLSLGAGLVVAGLAQRSRFCTIGGIRDLFLMGDSHLLQGLLALLAVAFTMNLILGQFQPGASPIAHSEIIWNVGAMFVVGLGLVLISGCPFRQMIMAGYGNTDAGITLLGMLLGTGLAHNFRLVASSLGVPSGGKIAIIIGVAALLAIGGTNICTQQRE